MDNYYNGYQQTYLFHYIVVKKGDVYLAVAHNRWQNIGSNTQYISLINQGCIYWEEVDALNEENAISLAKEHESQYVTKLQLENESLKNELKKIKSEGGVWNQNPLVVMGFKETDAPSKEELKSRKKKLSNVCHPDKKDGSEFLMKLINTACKQLNI
ncbi:hypothetical protein I5F12_14215 [Proteus cibarius]|uniref:hypothetical protein n=1 Tax=Proteus terrae TaxID=1574161 RepID=UPI0018C45AB1|nr:hypothetical protein [Proteus terrae]MBG6039222.1 hypothetical protein [Proteus terrae subsp. cibarius]